MKRFFLLLPLVFTVACGSEGGGSDVTGPSNSIPNVAGNYSTHYQLPDSRPAPSA